jgi:hypothetical protein
MTWAVAASIRPWNIRTLPGRQFLVNGRPAKITTGRPGVNCAVGALEHFRDCCTWWRSNCLSCAGMLLAGARADITCTRTTGDQDLFGLSVWGRPAH